MRFMMTLADTVRVVHRYYIDTAMPVLATTSTTRARQQGNRARLLSSLHTDELFMTLYGLSGPCMRIQQRYNIHGLISVGAFLAHSPYHTASPLGVEAVYSTYCTCKIAQGPK